MQTQIRGEQIDIEDLATDIVTGSPAAAKDILATEFLLRDGTVNMTGNLDVGSNSILNASIDAALIDSGTFDNARVAVGNVTQHVASIDHDMLLNYSDTQHRTINDGGTGVTDLWSASKIDSELSSQTLALTTKVDKPVASVPPPGVGAVTLMDPTDPGNIVDSTVAATGLGSPPGPPVLPLLPVLPKATLGPLGPGVAIYPPGTLVFVPDAAPPGSPPSGPPEFVLAYVGDIFLGSPPAPVGPTWLRADTGLLLV